MVKPRRAFHNLNSTSVDLDVDIPGLQLQGIGQDAQQSVQQGAGPDKASRELRALDPLTHSSQASAVPELPIERQQAQKQTHEFKTVEHAKPPLADTRYGVVDQGISDPHVLRLSMYNIPSTKALRDRTQLPLCLIARPFAAEIESVDFSHHPDVPRCGRCWAFVNPATQFTQGGDALVCNLCHFTTRVPDWYFEPADYTGNRTRGPELSSGTYDLKLPAKYGESTSEPRYIFLIDVTRDSLNKAIPTICGEAILEALYAQNVLPPGAKIAICSFARTMHVYRFGGSSVEMLVQTNVEDPILPPDMFVDPYEHHEQIEELLQNIQGYFKENWEPKSCLGGAIQACLSALAGMGGGRVIVTAATLPNLDPGALVRRDSQTYTTSISSQHEPEPQLFSTPSKFYRDLADNFAAEGAACDLFIFPTGYSDLATLSLMSKQSGGQLHSYPRYVAQRDARAFMADLVQVCKNTPMRNCIVKVRTSLGLQVEKYWGIRAEEPTGIMDEQSCFMVDFTHDGGSLDTRMDAYFQVAVIYTHIDGSRHLRVCNIPAGVTDQFKNVLKFVDSDACIGAVTRHALSNLSQVSLEEIRKGITQKVYDIFGACRAYAGGPLPPSQLLMPTSLRCFLPYSNALIKSIALTEKSFSVDSRCVSAHHLASSHADALSLLLYPRVYCLEKLFEYEGDLEDLPMVDASMEKLSTCCLIFNGRIMTIWIATIINEQLLVDLFGVTSRDQISAYWDEIPVLDTEINRKTRELIDWLAGRVNRSWIPLQIARQELDGAEYTVSAQLVDDPQGVLAPYSIFLSNVHTHAKKEAYRLESGRNWL